MSKTPGTTPASQSGDDPSQQPRQTKTPKPREEHAIADEDHAKARENLGDKVPEKPKAQGK